MSNKRVFLKLAVLLLLPLASCNTPQTTTLRPTDTAVAVPSATSAPTNESSVLEINVDSCGANPFDNQPDDKAIQTCLEQARSGNRILFTSPGGNPTYQGYIIDQTVILVHPSVKHDLTFTSTDPEDHALLIASPELHGFVAQLYARSMMTDPGKIDAIVVEHLDLDGNRAERKCYGDDQIMNGADDNWGSWIPGECTSAEDPWCSAGTLAMRGFFGDDSSNGIFVRNAVISNTECGTALAFHSINGGIDSVTIDTAGDHVHGPGCDLTDPDEASGAWSDGITYAAFYSEITNNTIINASDIDMVCFACTYTTIANNTIIAEPGNHGMFAGIALHPFNLGFMSGTVIRNNRVTNLGDETCGGIHAGINLGAHMWNAGCIPSGGPYLIGTSGICSALSPPPNGANCLADQPCRVWGYIPEGETLTLADNVVVGAQVNYLIEGMEFEGEVILSNNISEDPRMTDWENDADCSRDGIRASWGTIDFAAHDPVLSGWTDQMIYCER